MGDPAAVMRRVGDGDWHDYEKEALVYARTGMPFPAWVSYFGIPIVTSVPIAVFVPIACRLYAGHGYLESAALTLQERNLAAYVEHAQQSVSRMIDLVWA